MHNIKNDIKNRIFSPVYIFTGEEQYLFDYYTKEIISIVTDTDTREFNLMKIYNSLPDETEIDTFANSFPFMSEKKILIIESTGIFKKCTENQKAYFSSLISGMPEHLIIIFSEKDIDKRNSLYKQISKIYPVCEFDYQDIPTLKTWFSKLITAQNRAISSDDAQYICEIAGPSMHPLSSEAEKLISFVSEGGTIERSVIDTLVAKNVENRVFAMIDDIANGNRNDAVSKLNDLKTLGEEPVKIISIIFKKFATFHKLIILKDRPMREICSMCGLYEKHARNNLNQAQKLGMKRIANVMLKCRDMDFAIKNGTADKWSAIEAIIAEVLL